MRIIGVDPSTTCTGVAVLDGPPPVIVTAERLRSRAGGQEPLAYLRRTVALCADLVEIINEHEPSRAVIEMPHGKAHGRMGRINMASLAIYGVACGALWYVLEAHVKKVRAASVGEIRMSKQQRQQVVMAVFPQYQPRADPGMDVSDALWLALRELERESEHG